MARIGMVFHQLLRVEALSVFTQRCPFPESELELNQFWEYLYSKTPNVGLEYRDDSSAALQHFAILLMIKKFKTPIKRLMLDFVPIEVFEYLENAKIKLGKGNFVDLFKGSHTEVRHLHIVISLNSFDAENPLEYTSSALSQWLGMMPNLRNLIMAWSDNANDDIARRTDTSIYLHNWRILRRPSFENTWPNLKTLKLYNFGTTDGLLLQFLLKSAPSLQSLTLSACFFDYGLEASRVPSSVWGLDFEKGNFRRFLEGLKRHTKVRWLRVQYSTEGGMASLPLWTDHGRLGGDKKDDDQIARMEQEPGSRQSASDHVLLNLFLRDGCPWPMVHDDPDPSTWPPELSPRKRLPEWANEVEEDPADSPYLGVNFLISPIEYVAGKDTCGVTRQKNLLVSVRL